MIKKGKKGRFPSGPVDWWSSLVRTLLPLQGAWVQSLGGKLRSHMLCSAPLPKKKFFKGKKLNENFKKKKNIMNKDVLRICQENTVGNSRSVVPDSATPWTVACTKFLHPWDFLGKNTGVGCCFLLQGIFPTQGPNPGLLRCRQTPYRLSPQGSPALTYSESRS